MVWLQGVAPNSFPYFHHPPTAGFPLVKSERGTGDGKRRGDKWHLSVAFPRPKESAFAGGNYPTGFILLRHRFLVQIRPIFKGSFCILSISPFTAKTRQEPRPSSTPKPCLQKILRKNFWKGDDICHIFCAIIETKEDTHARNQSL